MGCLENPGKHPGVIEQLSSRYSFVLARHVEQVIDQGQLDRQRNRESVPESSAPIGGLRGEVQSWLPQSYVQRFYRVGGQSLTATEKKSWPSYAQRYVAWWMKYCTSST